MPLRPSQSKTMVAAVGSSAASASPHDFDRRNEPKPGWCDICDQMIWGLTHGSFVHKKLHAATSRPREGATQDGVVFTYSPVIATDGVPRPRALQCKQCFLVAHEHCAKTTRRGCHGGAALVRMRRETAVDDVIVAASRRESHLTVPAHSPDRGGTKKGFPTQGLLSSKRREDVVALLDAFNASRASGGYPLVMDPVGGEDSPCTFSGRVAIHLNLTKPIKVLGETKSDIINQVVEENVWIPRGLTKQVQLYSTMTTQAVIQGLLGKLRALTPRSRFALYELDLTSHRSRKLEDFEEPLVLMLLSGGESKGRVLSLEDRPNETNAWEIFATIELENFVRALDTEEQRTIRTIEIEYDRRRARLKAAIAQLKGRPGAL